MNFDVDVFRDHWHLICHRNELPQNGDYIRLQTVLGDLVVFNDDGDLVAFDNLCPHRGARMFSGIEGNQPATCAYHGWAYRHGRMVIPMVESFSGCDIHTAQLNKYRVDWCGDFLFVGVTPRQPLYEQLAGTAEVLENISFNISGRLDFNSHDWQSCWAVAVENALEPYHIGMVHPSTLGTLQLGEGVNEYHGQNSIWTAPVGNTRVDKQLRMLKKQFAIDYGYEGYMSVYLFPFTMISSTYGYSYSLQHFFPSAPGQATCHFSSRLLLANSAGEQAQKILAPLFASTAQVNRKVFAEDHEVCKLVPRGSWSMEPLRYASVVEEKIGRFREACREYIQGT